jgi:hypothetical protein
VVVFTKYDVLVESLKPPEEEDFYGDIEKEIEYLDREVDPDIGAYQTDPHVLSLAEKKLCEMITPFGETLAVPWVKVSGLRFLPFVLSAKLNWLILKPVKPEFSDTLDELVNVTKQRIHNSLELLWAITQQQSVVPKIKASIECVQVPSFCGAAGDWADICKVLARKVRFKVYFWLCIHQVQGYWQGLSTGPKLASRGKSLEKWFKVIHKDIATYVHCFSYICAISPLIEESGIFTTLWMYAYVASYLVRWLMIV